MKKISEHKCLKELEKIVNYKTELVSKEKNKPDNVNNLFLIEKSQINIDGIFLDDEDIKTLLFDKDAIFFETIETENFTEAKKALKEIVNNFENIAFSLKSSQGVVVYVTVCKEVDLMLLSEISETIFNSFGHMPRSKESHYIWGVKYDSSMKIDEIKISLFASF